MGYRADYFKQHKSVNGKWKCVRCGGWFTKKEIEIDHRIPKRKGGTDDVWNLQALCRHCNRSKRDRNSWVETASTMTRATLHGDLGTAITGIVRQKTDDIFKVKYRRK